MVFTTSENQYFYRIATRYYINLSNEQINVTTGLLYDDIYSQNRVSFRPLNDNRFVMVHRKEGILLYNSFWLPQRNDKLAKEIIKKHINLAKRRPSKNYCAIMDFEMVTH